MKNLKELNQIKNLIDEDLVTSCVKDALLGADDGECFIEHKESSSVSWSNGKLRSSNFSLEQGFGLRFVKDKSIAYSHSSNLDLSSFQSSAKEIRSANFVNEEDLKQSKFKNLEAVGERKELYSAINPIKEKRNDEKILLMQEIESYAKSLDPMVQQVSASLSSSLQAVKIIQPTGQIIDDIRPLTSMSIQVTMQTPEGLSEVGFDGFGGRDSILKYIDEVAWKESVRRAIDQARVNLKAKPCKAGEITVVLGGGWPGILLHEAIGHGLEADFNRKKVSVFSDLMGKEVASPIVNVVDNGTLGQRRGSIQVDDEGTPTSNTLLIENGILKNYMQDRMSAGIMGSKLTGNGRRESYASIPIPRMTNTYMLAGQDSPEDIISSVKDGIYAKSFSGGQVDITSGQFVFQCVEAYKIEDGKIVFPVKGATLIGAGHEVLKNITAVGNDLQLDNGIGTCVKDGQCVPVGVGMPTVKIEKLTVGGTEL